VTQYARDEEEEQGGFKPSMLEPGVQGWNKVVMNQLVIEVPKRPG
jgi:hypothetical protein